MIPWPKRPAKSTNATPHATVAPANAGTHNPCIGWVRAKKQCSSWPGKSAKRVFARDNPGIALGTDATSGVVFTFGALVSMVAGTVLYKRLAPQGSLWIGNGVQNTAAGLVLIPFAAFADSGTITLNWQLALAFAFLVLFVSIFAYLIWFHLLDAFGATAASSFHFLMPPLGLLFGWLLLREHIALSDLLGIIPVALGIWLVTRGDRARVAVSEEGVI